MALKAQATVRIENKMIVIPSRCFFFAFLELLLFSSVLDDSLCTSSCGLLEGASTSAGSSVSVISFFSFPSIKPSQPITAHILAGVKWLGKVVMNLAVRQEQPRKRSKNEALLASSCVCFWGFGHGFGANQPGRPTVQQTECMEHIKSQHLFCWSHFQTVRNPSHHSVTVLVIPLNSRSAYGIP